MTSVVPPSEQAKVRFGERLRYWRERAGLTQIQLATRLRYDNTLICRVERGQRVVSLAMAAQADEVLSAGGELTDLAVAALTERGAPHDLRFLGPAAAKATESDLADTESVPLPGNSLDSVDPLVLVVPSWTSAGGGLRYATQCPLHTDRDCAEACLAAAVDPERLTVHAYLGRLACYRRASVELVTTPALVAQVEHTIHGVVVHIGQSRRSAERAALLHIAANFGALVGRLRINLGQRGAAMAWLHRGARWAEGAGNTVALCDIMASMSVVAQMEDDLDSGAKYAEAARAVDRSRPWTIAHGRLHAARTAAQRGDRAGFERHCAGARGATARFTERDRVEAPWLVGAEGDAFVNAYLAGGLRDLAARNDDRAAARRGADCARAALASLPSHMHPSRLLLVLRLADCQARAGELDAAEACLALVADDAIDSGLALIDRELRSLGGALGLADDLLCTRSR